MGRQLEDQVQEILVTKVTDVCNDVCVGEPLQCSDFILELDYKKGKCKYLLHFLSAKENEEIYLVPRLQSASYWANVP